MNGGKTSPARLLVVDDSLDTLEVLRRNLERAGHRVRTATTVAEATRVLAEGPQDVVITDLKLPGASGIDLIRHVRENFRGTEVLMITGYPSVEGAVSALREGALDYLPKPFTSEELLAALGRVLLKLGARRAIAGEDDGASTSGLDLVGTTPAMRAAFATVRAASATALPLFVIGEPGTGRTAVARAVHTGGPRCASPYIALELAHTPAARIAIDLFGTAAGGGAWNAARGGTLYLGDLPLLAVDLQERLLRALDEPTAPRLIASCAVPPGPRIAGALHPALLARFAVDVVSLPPLAERADDVLPLVRHVALRAAQRVGRAVPEFDDAVLAAFAHYAWPGHVAELDRTVRALAQRGAGRVELPDLPLPLRSAAARPSVPDRPLAEVEAAYIREVLAAVAGNRTRAAEILGIDRKTLREKLKR